MKSKGLEALKHLVDIMPFVFLESHKKQSCVETIEKELKVLEIIVKKEVNVSMLKSYLKCGVGLKDFTYEEYKKYNHTIFSKNKLIEEEFNLLREVL